MPEGDTIFKTAETLRLALVGRTVEALELVAPKTSAAAARCRIEGGNVLAVEPNGKHLFITFSTDREDVVLHTHMKMTGEWHIYRPGERWRRPAADARVVIRTGTYVAPCFHPPIVELITARELAIHPMVSKLGPDVLAGDFDLDEAVRRIGANPDRDIATALLDQRSLSGVGNVFKCEALFLERLSPWAQVGALAEPVVRQLVERCRELMLLNRRGRRRRTYFSLDPDELMWVDERTGLPCRVCRTPVEWGWHPDEVRKSWYCPSCQGVSLRSRPSPVVTPERGSGSAP